MVKKQMIWLGLAVGMAIAPGFAPSQATPIPAATVALAPQDIDFAPHFASLGIEGSILIYDQKGDQFFEHNPRRNRTPFPTASTFKIFNSLVALETGVLPHDLAVLTWDGVPRLIPSWNRDLNLREAFKISAVWFYQVIARRVGHEQMQQYIEAAQFGNQRLGPPEEIDQFWLNGTLRITPRQQVEFLRRLHQGDLPFSARSLTLVKDLMIAEQTPDYTIRAKTGWYGYGDEAIANIGWYVGYVETQDNVYFFATNIDIDKPEAAAARLHLTRLCLQTLGIL